MILKFALSVATAQVVDIPTRDRVLDLRSVSRESLRLEVNRKAHELTVYSGATKIKTYPVAIGRIGWETPTGTFHVLQKLRDPTWVHPLNGKEFPAADPGNELGHYWIGFAKAGENSIGFHGTPHPNSVGQSLSHGCIRMHEKDIAELFQEVRIGTVVTVLP